MIDFLRGKPAHCESDYVVLDVHGVGYQVFCANPYAIQAKEQAAPGAEVTLYTHHHVREDAVQLYGFETREEQALFRRLLDVSGIGPKVALGMLSAGRPDEVVAAIYQENIPFLMKLPGIGKKTAQRIILDLKDKLADLPLGTGALAGLSVDAGGRMTSAGASLAAGAGSGATLGRVWLEAKEALLALGYTEAEADRIWPQVQERAQETDGVDKLVKLALQILFRG